MAEEAAIDLTIKTGEAEKNTQSLKSKLKELKQQMSQLKEGSAEFNAVAKEAGKLEDKIGDINQKVRTLASDTKRLDAFVGAAQGIAGGFAAAQGAVALFGGENEELNKTLLKVQGSLALLNGVEAISNTFKKENAVLTNLQTAAQAIYTTVVGTSTGALKLFKIALAATGIGLVVVAIGELVAHWEDLTKWIKGSTEELDKNIEATKRSTEAMKSQQKQMEQNIKDFRDKELASLNEIKAIREAQGLDTVEIDKKIREARLRNGETETQLEIEEIKKRTEKKVQAIKDRAQREQEEKDKAEEAAIKRAEEWEKKAKDQAEQQEKDKIEREKTTAEAIKSNESDLMDFIEKLHKEQDKKEEDAKNKRIQDAKDEAAAKKKLQDDTFALTAQSLNATKSLSDVFYQHQLNQVAGNDKKTREIRKKQFETNKIFTVSQIVLDTIMGMMKALASSPPPSPIGIASSIAVGIAGTAATIQALATKFDGGSTPNVTAPNTPSTGNTPTGQVPTIPNTPQSIPIPQQVYVTETDISGTQHKVNVIENLSKIH